VTGGPPSQPTIEIEDADPLRLAFFEQSDLGNADRLKALANGKLKWIEDLACWAYYDGKRFDVERGAIEAQKLAHRVVRHIRTESAEIYALADRCGNGEVEALELLNRLKGPKYEADKLKTLGSGLIKHALKSGSASMTAGMLRQARSDLAALSEDFDKDPLAYNVQNCTLRFVKSPSPRSPDGESPSPIKGEGAGWRVTFAPHDPSDLLMQIADVEYDPKADCPFWKERLDQICPDEEQKRALQLLYGYTLTGLTSDQAFYVNQGVGNDGKSTTHQALGELHGDYFKHAGVKTFLQGADRGGAEHRSDLVRLRGDVRFVTCDEPKGRAVWDGETIKQVTGSLITARGSNERTEITYRPRFKLFIECNSIPRAPSDDKGFRRRFKLYQWTVSLPATGEPGHIPIDEALEALRAERSGILNWMIEGAIGWLTTRTIPQPAAMIAVLSDFWADSSPLLEWLAERCDTSDATASEPAKDLYDDFKAWFEAAVPDGQVMTSTRFGTSLRDKQFSVFKDRHGNRHRRGIRLMNAAERDGLLARAASSSAAEPTRGVEPAAFDPDEDDVP
jgi:putative DNA primase/helicase